MKPIEFPKEDLQDYSRASSLEWLEANGIGGYASSTVTGAHTRRYHGLLVASMRPPVERNVVLSKLDETLVIGDRRVELATNTYGGVIHPSGFQQSYPFQKGFLSTSSPTKQKALPYKRQLPPSTERIQQSSFMKCWIPIMSSHLSCFP